ncbi:MAG TPA: hypothetical protein VK762_12965 [Polyangiaceae bacterium]|jgi:hypothetical protein|nr:hypothetical protein [Polyangiaceae bacterium]
MTHNGNRNGKVREDLLRQSQDMRDKLVRTVERLDGRRHDAFDVRKQLERHLKQFAIAGGLVILGAAASSAFVMYRLMTTERRRSRARWRLAKDVWRHPDRELRAQRGSFGSEVARSVAFSIATSLLAAPLRRALRGLR